VKHASSRALYEYWNDRRGMRSAPERGDIEPGGIGRSLGDSFILAFDPAAAHPFRLAGTRICGLFGRELRAAPFETLWREGDRRAIRDLVTAVADESAGLVAGAQGRTEEGYTIDLELLLLPLRQRGRTHVRQIGVLAPLNVPFWLGSSPVVDLALGACRHLGAASESSVATAFVLEHGGRPSRGLVIFDGGRP
jgi:hypothetical protein